MMKLTKKGMTVLFILYITFYFIANLWNLTLFPFVHSDEPWLSGLTRNMLETGSIYCTETFFDLYPRFPHSIKLIFHLIQMPFILLFGYQVFSVRLVSLIFGTLSLIIFYKITYHLLRNRLYTLLTTILLSLNIQYLYATRFARQEIVLIFFFLLAMLHYISIKKDSNEQIKPLGEMKGFIRVSLAKLRILNPHILLGIIIGLSIGIHPNSFLIAMFFGMCYLGDIWVKKSKAKDLFYLIASTACMATLFVILSYVGDPRFIHHYTSYGNTLGVSATFIDKIMALPDFYGKLYQGISGTYYTPSIRGYLIAFVIITVPAILLLIRDRRNLNILRLLLGIIGIHLGFIIIGRYNQTSVIFIFPFFYLLGLLVLDRIMKHYGRLVPALMGFCLLLSGYTSYREIKPYMNYSYDHYIEQLSAIPPWAKTLGNLNMEFYFQNGALLDYRNLALLEDRGLTFSDYIRTNNISYIIYTEELSYLHRNPQWQVLYGDDSSYYDDMMYFLETSCTVMDSFNHEVYGIRIPRYMFDYPWTITIYRVNIS